MLAGAEPGSFNKINHRDRRSSELFAMLAGGGHILAAKLRMLVKELARVAFHEREIQSPPGEAQERNPNKFLFQEKFQKRNFVSENVLQNNDVRPGTMIADYKIRGMRIQIGQAFDIPFYISCDLQNQTVAGHPLRSKRNQDQGTPVAESRGKEDKFQQNDGDKKGNPEQRIKCDQ
jgi:hypothetical protein